MLKIPGTCLRLLVQTANLHKSSLALLLALTVSVTATQAATINGTVRKSTDSTAITGAKVVWIAGTTRTDSTVTDALGAYTLTGVTTGTRSVMVSAVGYGTVTNSVNVANDSTTYTSNFLLSAPGSISGTVRRSADSLALAGVKIYLRRTSTTAAIVDSAVSDALGAYAFAGLTAGTPNYFVTFTATGYATASNSNLVVNGGANTVSNIYLTSLGKISGRVRKLSDSSSIVNALVLLRRGTTDTTAILDSARTDSIGGYTFASLAASSGNRYRVYASAPGYMNASNVDISVTNGNTSTSNLYLGVAASLSGTVRKGLDSTVIANASVYLRRTSATSAILDSVKTDTAGRYSFTNLAPGAPAYWVTAAKDSLVAATNGNIALPSGGAVVSNLYLYPVLPGSISGTVRKASDSTAIAGAKLYLRRTSTTSAILDSTVSDGAGAYGFAGLQAGTPNYFVTTSVTGYATTSASNIVVNNNANTVANLYLATLGKITARVRKLSDSTNVANALVLLRRGTSDTTAILDSARTDSLGAATFHNLAASTGGGGGGATQYRVYASAPGFVNAQNTGISVSNGATTTTNLYLGLPGTINGTVRKSVDSTVLANAAVYLRRSSGTSTVLDSAKTDSLGRYTFANVATGTPNYWITASAAAYVSATNTNVAVASGATVTSNLYLAPVLPGSITGTVRKLPDSLAVAGAVIKLRRGSDTAAVIDSAVTDSLGRYTFPTLTAGTPNYWISATKAGLITGSNTNVSVPNGGTATSNFLLAVPATLTGTIRRMPDSLALRGALVQMRRGGSTSAIVDSARTDSLGRYTFANLPPANNYRITASFAGYTTASNTNINVTSGATVTSNLTLAVAARGRIYGKVGKAGDSTIIANARLLLRRGSDTSAVIDSVRSDSTGRYAFANLIAGTPNYWVTASATGYNAATNANVAVIANDSTLSDFALTVVVSIARGRGVAAQKAFTASRAANGWLIRLPASNSVRTFTVHDARGALLHRAVVSAGATELIIPATATQAGALMRLE